jgi:transcriptional regulator with XRE-family HTH domain
MDASSNKMEYSTSVIELRLAARVRHLRVRRGFSLDGLAKQSGVSRSMISLIERAESSPTASVLDKLAPGLGVALASLFAEEQRAHGRPVARRADQPTWSDPETGHIRRNPSPPAFPSVIDLVEVVLPPGTRVAHDSGFRTRAVDQQVWVLEGGLEVSVGKDVHRLAAGSRCGSMGRLPFAT